jgi:cysteine desulfurase
MTKDVGPVRSKPIYLDHNATSPALPEVVEAVAKVWRSGLANPSSQHAAGRAARAVLEAAREEIAQRLGGDLNAKTPDRLLLTSGATEANNLAVFGLVDESPGRVIVSSVEHPSLAAAADELEQRGWSVQRIGVSRSGQVDPDELDHLIMASTEHTQLVSIVTADSETGVLQPIPELADVCHRHGVLFHTDATQAAGKCELHFRKSHIGAMSFSGHKFQAPSGIGGLLLRHDVRPRPQLFGGFQQAGLRPGTENPALAAGMATALRLWDENRTAWYARIASLRESLEQSLQKSCPELVILGGDVPRVPQTSNVAWPGLDRQALQIALDLAGLACSTGTACASGSSEPSPIIRAWGVDEAIIAGALRFSLGPTITPQEIGEAVQRILLCAGRLRSRVTAGA